MKKDVAYKLIDKANMLVDVYSNADREYNHNKETFTLSELTPLGDNLAYAIYEKSTGKKVLVVLVYVIASGGYWINFIPSASHILGLERLKDVYFSIEKHNFTKNGQQ